MCSDELGRNCCVIVQRNLLELTATVAAVMSVARPRSAEFAGRLRSGQPATAAQSAGMSRFSHATFFAHIRIFQSHIAFLLNNPVILDYST